MCQPVKIATLLLLMEGGLVFLLVLPFRLNYYVFITEVLLSICPDAFIFIR